ncbi:hypothetical protein C8A03DRAFT_13997 [Achaetomium macrosporum]|uniref:RRM domain-containing protein n=1 Tax=Achaetomium macrosporum TaxID=79813 RepID=A0AAN7HCD1_9PEZI|nr:hypothetical protein C8A03DRAFT_13997 [Achaetomium macrosporum]
MHRHHPRNHKLITVTVRPGSETGLYYILVANLAHSTTWRDLKAFAEQACEVDHAEVYPPTSGFVRVKGRANFERAFKHLDGNTLDYRALQADARNMNQSTVVKLPPNDYHAARIVRGDTSRIFDEPGAPTAEFNAQNQAFPQGPGPTMGSPFLGYQASGSPALNMALPTSAPWGYLASPSYVPPEGLQVGAANEISMRHGPMAYQVATTPAHGFSQQAVASTHFSISQSMGYPAGPAAAQPMAVQYPYGASPEFYTEEGYDVPGQGYAGYAQPARNNSDHAYFAGYGETLPADSSLEMPAASQTNVYATDRPPTAAAVVVEQRKIVILNLERDGLSETVVKNLVAKHAAGLGTRPGEIERVEVPVNKDGRARGIAFVTFNAAQLARAAVAALDGREAGGGGGKRLSARLAEGVSPREGGRRGGYNSNHRRGRQRAQASDSPGGGSGNGSVKKGREDPPIIVDGSGGRWREKQAPFVVGGSAGKRGNGGHRGRGPGP